MLRDLLILAKMLFHDRKMIRVDPTNMAFTAK